MNPSSPDPLDPLPSLSEGGAWAKAWGDALISPGYGVFPGMVSAATCLGLSESMTQRCESDAMVRARTGRGEGLDWRPEIRTDEIHWLSGDSGNAAEDAWLGRMEEARLQLRQELRLPLDHFEAHLARYAPGGFYKPHLDQSAGTRSRQISVVLYLNADWEVEDGGQLRIFTTPDVTPVAGDASMLILPLAGTVVVFRSADFWHEVLVSRRQRHSLTGWFRFAGPT